MRSEAEVRAHIAMKAAEDDDFRARLTADPPRDRRGGDGPAVPGRLPAARARGVGHRRPPGAPAEAGAQPGATGPHRRRNDDKRVVVMHASTAATRHPGGRTYSQSRPPTSTVPPPVAIVDQNHLKVTVAGDVVEAKGYVGMSFVPLRPLPDGFGSRPPGSRSRPGDWPARSGGFRKGLENEGFGARSAFVRQVAVSRAGDRKPGEARAAGRPVAGHGAARVVDSGGVDADPAGRGCLERPSATSNAA